MFIHAANLEESYVFYELFVIDDNGANVRQLTKGASVTAAQWSPDSQWIWFLGDYRGTSGLQKITSDGIEHMTFGRIGDNVSGITLTQDGNSVVMIRGTGVIYNPEPKLVTHAGLYIMSTDGSKIKLLKESSPEFGELLGKPMLPDDTTIIFSAHRSDDDTFTTYKINIDGSGLAPFYGGTESLTNLELSGSLPERS